MEEENQQQEMNQMQQVTTNDPKKAEVGKRLGKRLAKYNHKKREDLKVKKSEVSQYYGIGALLAVGAIGGLGYYIYQAKKGEVEPPPQQPCPQNNKFEME